MYLNSQTTNSKILSINNKRLYRNISIRGECNINGVTGRLIGQDHLRPEHYGTGYGHTLLLAARQLVREVPAAMADIHALHDFFNLPLALGGFYIHVSQWQLDVLGHIQFVYQVETLEHEPNLALAHVRTVFFFQALHLTPGQPVFPATGVVEQSKDIDTIYSAIKSR